MTVFQDGLLAFFCSVGVTTILWLAAGLACGCVFWVQRYRTEREKRTTV